MIKVDLLTSANKKAGEVELNPDIFASPINSAVMHQVVVMQLAKRRSGTASTKNRAIVSGGGENHGDRKERAVLVPGLFVRRFGLEGA
jgi:large subunit ribosomal protein L4